MSPSRRPCPVDAISSATALTCPFVAVSVSVDRSASRCEQGVRPLQASVAAGTTRFDEPECRRLGRRERPARQHELLGRTPGRSRAPGAGSPPMPAGCPARPRGSRTRRRRRRRAGRTRRRARPRRRRSGRAHRPRSTARMPVIASAMIRGRGRRPRASAGPGRDGRSRRGRTRRRTTARRRSTPTTFTPRCAVEPPRRLGELDEMLSRQRVEAFGPMQLEAPDRSVDGDAEALELGWHHRQRIHPKPDAAGDLHSHRGWLRAATPASAHHTLGWPQTLGWARRDTIECVATASLQALWHVHRTSTRWPT